MLSVPHQPAGALRIGQVQCQVQTGRRPDVDAVSSLADRIVSGPGAPVPRYRCRVLNPVRLKLSPHWSTV